MAPNERFTLSESVEITLTERTLSVRNKHDIELEQTLGRLLETVASEGNVTLRLREVTGTILAAGNITIEGAVDADLIFGDNVTIRGPYIKARAIAANHTLTIESANLAADAVMAPTVILPKDIRGRVTLLESKNACDTGEITGAFSYEDYENRFGNADEFLERLGLEPPSQDGGGAASPEHDQTTGDQSDDESTTDDETADGEHALLEFHMEEVGGEIIPPPPDEVDGEAAPDENLPLFEPDKSTIQQLLAAVELVCSHYVDSEGPDALEKLVGFIEASNYSALRTNLPAIWNGVINFHLEKGAEPNRKVTHAFNQIHGMVSAD